MSEVVDAYVTIHVRLGSVSIEHSRLLELQDLLLLEIGWGLWQLHLRRT